MAMVAEWSIVLTIVGMLTGCYVFIFGVWRNGVGEMSEHKQEESVARAAIHKRIEECEIRLAGKQDDTRRELAEKIDRLIDQVGRLGGRLNEKE